MKRKLAGFIAAILFLSNPACMEQVNANTKSEAQADAMTVTSENTMTVSGTNSFGSLLAESLAAEIDKQDSNDGCNIFSIEINENNASVSFESTQDAAIVVGIYDEDGMEMLASGIKEIVTGEEQTTVTINIENMPEFFYLRGFLVDIETLRPLCSVYESPNYTREMQEFLNKTTDDFDSDRVLNLDNNENNNFAVLNDEVTIISDEDLIITSIDEESNTYVFKNADSLTAMNHGDKFSYEQEEGNLLIVKVDSVSIDGDTVTVTGMDTSMEDVFTYVKIDTTTDMSDVTVDDTTCGDGVVFNGIVSDTEETRQLRAVDIEGQVSRSLSYTFLEDKTAGISGDINIKIDGSIKVFISSSYKYLELKLDYSSKVNVKVSSKYEEKLPLGFVGISPVPGVCIEFTPSFVTKVSATISISGNLTGTIGFRATVGRGIENISKSPRFEMNGIKGEFTAYIGLSLEPKIIIISDYLANASLDVTVGVEAKGIMKNAKASSSKIHECKACIDGDIVAKMQLEFKTELLNFDEFTFKFATSLSAKVSDWFFSLDYAEFGLTTCPHYLYKITITVLDENNNPIKNAVLEVPFIIITKNELGIEERTVLSTVTTNDDGKVDGYLASGTYYVNVSAGDFIGDTKRLVVGDDAKSVRTQLGKKSNGSDQGDGNPKPPSGGDFDDNEVSLLEKNAQTISLGEWRSGAVTKDGSLYMWGSNLSGELGDGTIIGKTSPIKVLDNVVSVSLGNQHSGAITKDGSLYIWGTNTFGRLGDGTTVDKRIPVKVLDNVVLLSLGAYHSGAVTEDGSLYMWGYNKYGQLGDGTTEDKSSPVKVLDNVVSVSLGEYHTGAITEDGSLYMWGDNGYGELGDGTTVNKSNPIKVLDNVTKISLGAGHSGAITEDGSLYMWGCNAFGQVGDGRTWDRKNPVKVLDNVVSVRLGSWHSGAITEDGSLYMWGYNSHGQLGDGTTVDRTRPVKVFDNVVLVGLGNTHTGAVTKYGVLYMWGQNNYGQLGNGTTLDSSSPVEILDEIKIWSDSVRLNVMEPQSGRAKHSFFSLQKVGTQMPETITETDNNNRIIATFDNLVPNSLYNFYAMQDKDAKQLLCSQNLLYITQMMSDENGRISVAYSLRDNLSDADIFLIGKEQEDLSSATVCLSDLEYNQNVQYVKPDVILQGKVLSEWKDYELLGDYSAQDVGEYTFIVHGIGEYKGSITVSYKIIEIKNGMIQNLILDVLNTSINVGNRLEIKALITPTDADNQKLKWSSSDKNVVTVSENGLVTAIGEGTATITVESTDGSNKKASCVIVVKKKNSNNPSNPTIPSYSDNMSISSQQWNSIIPSESKDENKSDSESGISSCIVSFNENGGTQLSDKTMTLEAGDNLGNLPKAKRKNYIFNGWYTKKIGGHKVTKYTEINDTITLYAHWTKVTKPTKIVTLELKNKKSGELSINYKKVKGAKGYEIIYSVNKAFPKAATERIFTTSTTKTLKKLKSGKMYYVKVRAYKIDSTGKKIYGSYSVIESVKAK